MDRTNERGLSTLEWILLVAAVGGLATIGVIVVRGAADDTADRTQSHAELAGEGRALKTLQGKVTNIMIKLRSIGREGTDQDRFNVCLGDLNATNWSTNSGDQQLQLINHMHPLQQNHSELYSFHPVSVDLDTAKKFPISNKADTTLVWCRVRYRVSGVCASIADETPVSDPPNNGYRDTNMYRIYGGHFNKDATPDASHNYPLSHTFCKGRV